MTAATHAIIVTHNSQSVLQRCLGQLEKQSVALKSCIIVDSGSSDTSYIDRATEHCLFPLEKITSDNIGFARANNLGYSKLNLAEQDMVIFLNPDTFVTSNLIEQSSTFLVQHRDIGILTGKLLGFDLKTCTPTGRIDSTGIFRKWYGRWYDRGQGETDESQYQKAGDVPAICGALMICRAECLMDLDGPIFDEDFFLYKEDIELSLRVRKIGWRLYYLPSIIAHHCRGWAAQRKKMSYGNRLMSAQNELKLYRRHRSPYIIWAMAKYLAVTLFDR